LHRERYGLSKKVAFLFLFVVLVLTGCTKQSYSFINSVEEIERIEIVDAKNSMEFTVIKTLSEEEKQTFLESFQKIEFAKYYIGDPMTVSGTAVKITYPDGDYEMICHYWAEYVKNGEIYSVRESCDESEFRELLASYVD